MLFLTGVPVCSGSDWSEGATEEIARLTLCALWRVVMVRVCTQELGEDPTVHIVDTTTNKVTILM